MSKFIKVTKIISGQPVNVIINSDHIVRIVEYSDNRGLEHSMIYFDDYSTALLVTDTQSELLERINL